MRAVALKGLAARKVRALLTALAVVIGVAMVSGTFILTDTTLKSFTGLFTASTANTDAVISGKEIVKNSTNGSGVTIPASMLEKVRALPEVKAAAGEVSPQEANVADIIGSDGKKVAMESVGGSYDAATAGLSPFKLKTGRAPHGPGEVAIDAGTADEEALRGRRLGRRLDPRQEAHLPHQRHALLRRASTRSASPASPPGTSRPPRPCSTARAATTRSRSPRRTAPRPRSS